MIRPRPSGPAHLTSYVNRDAYATDHATAALTFQAACPACGASCWWHCGPTRQPAPDCPCDPKDIAA